MIAIPLWTKESGGVSEIDKPGLYIFHCRIVAPSQLIGAHILLAGWSLTVQDVKRDADGSGSDIFVQVGPEKYADGSLVEAGLSPLQLNVILASGLLIVAAFFIDRVSKALDSPSFTLAFYLFFALAGYFLYKKLSGT